jgi:hypothetical protein
MRTRAMRLDLKCSSTGRDFTVLFKREPEDKLYKVVNIITDTAEIDADEIHYDGVLDIDVDQIDCNDIKCPWCEGGMWNFIECGGCRKLSCSGGVREFDGKYLHKCPWCGNEAFIERTVSKIEGKAKD